MYRQPKLVPIESNADDTPTPTTPSTKSRPPSSKQESEHFVDTPPGTVPLIEDPEEEPISVIDCYGTGSSFHGDIFGGSGTYYFSNETVYEGQFKDKTFDGKGHLFFPKLGM